MERLFCNGKKAFCENPGGCRDCDYADRSGAADEHTISALLSALFGEGYNLDRLRELVKADREGRCVVLNTGYTETAGGKALKQAMYLCSVTNNEVT